MRRLRLWSALFIGLAVIVLISIVVIPRRSTSFSPSPELFDGVIQLLSRQPHHGEGGGVTVQLIFNSSPFFKAQAMAEAQNTGKNPDLLFTVYKERYQLGEYLVFGVVMDTHSANLSALNMKSISLLRDDKGKVIPASRWEENQGSSSHHRSGKLFFPLKDTAGNLSIDTEAKFMEVTIKGIAGVEERVFRWNLPISYPSGL